MVRRGRFAAGDEELGAWEAGAPWEQDLEEWDDEEDWPCMDPERPPEKGRLMAGSIPVNSKPVNGPRSARQHPHSGQPTTHRTISRALRKGEGE